MTAWYNDDCAKTVAWLEKLRDHGAISSGHIDDRGVECVAPRDLQDVTWAHFFAGIGGWDYALQLAGWPKNQPVWTASLPCQPFSVAGQGKGVRDERHLWPIFRDLVEKCRPPILFGEQVASPAGRSWLAAVQADLEALGYSTAAADLCAAGVGAPHIRQRLYWVARTNRPRLEILSQQLAREYCASSERGGSDCRMAYPDSSGQRTWGTTSPSMGQWRPSESMCGMGNWEDIIFKPCGDGKSRPIKPGLEPLVNGVSNRLGRLRGYGNAIVPQVAAIFVRSVMDCLGVSYGGRFQTR